MKPRVERIARFISVAVALTVCAFMTWAEIVDLTTKSLVYGVFWWNVWVELWTLGAQLGLFVRMFLPVDTTFLQQPLAIVMASLFYGGGTYFLFWVCAFPIQILVRKARSM